MEWIKCSDNVPEWRTQVLTYEPGALMPIKANYIHNYENEWAYGHTSRISHWRSLPNPPDE